MTMKGDSQENWFDPEDRSGPGSFQEHTEYMNIFHKTHASGSETGRDNAARSSYQERVPTFRVALTVSETGGSATPAASVDWLSLVPMWRMALRRFSPN